MKLVYTIIGIFGVVVVIGLLFFALKPVITGFAVGEWESEKEGMQSQIASLNESLGSCSSLNDQLSEDLKKAESDVEAAKNKMEEVREKCADEKSKLRQEYSDLSAERDAVVLSSARNICCKAKIDNNNINYYEVQNSKIVCLEEGENELNCW